jgi:E3 ubiquitin-protein ligase TRIP12
MIGREISHEFSAQIVKPDLYGHLLDQYIQKLLLEPLNLVLETKKNKCYDLVKIFMNNPYLINFDTRVLFFKTAAFAYSGDFNRTVYFLLQHLKRKYPNIPEQSVSKQSRQKQKVIRENLLESAINLLTSPSTIKRKNFLEIEYTNEEGTGLGPTMEFYHICSKEFRSMTELWKDTEDFSLFPAPFPISAARYGEDRVVKFFEAMG